MKIKSLILVFTLSLLLSPDALAFVKNSSVVDTRVEQIRALRTKDPSLLNAYLDLMEKEKLIDQSDARLEKRELLQENGGLCAFTAQVNAVQAVSQYYQIAKSKFLKRPDYFLYQIVHEAYAFMTEDPRYAGAYLSDLAIYTLNVLEEYGLDQIVDIKYFDDPEKLIAKNFKTYYWKLRLLGVSSENKKEGHTFILLKLDPDFMYVSDPNFPNEVISIRYKQTQKGLKVYLTEEFPGFQPATVDEIIEVNVLKD